MTQVSEPTEARRETALEPSERSASLLSVEQEHLWFLQVAQQQSATTYNIGVALDLDGPLDRAALDAALGDVVRRQEALRAAFPSGADGLSCAVRDPSWSFTPRVIDLSPLAPDARADALARGEREQARALFDLERGPLVRTVLFALGATRHVLVVTANELVFDRPSARLLAAELAERYRIRMRGGSAPAPEDLALSYRDYAARQREWCAGPEAEAMLERWRDALRGYGGIELPFERTYSLYNRWLTSEGDVLVLPWAFELVAAVERFAEREATEPLVVLQAAHAALLHRHSGQANIALGMTVDGRPPEARGVIGSFESVLPIRLDLSGDPSFGELVGRVRRAVETARANALVPSPLIVEAIRPDFAGEAPLLVMTAVGMSEPMPKLDFGGGLVARGRMLHDGTARLDFTVDVEADGSSARAIVEYSPLLFGEASIERLVERLAFVLRTGVDEPARRLSELPIATAEEIRVVLEEWNDTALPDTPATIVERFDAKAAELPRQAAVRDEAGAELTYEELRARANRLAHHLISLGVRPGDRCAILLDRTVQVVVAALGVLKAGAAYVPLDPEMPLERATAILDDSGATAVVTERARAGHVPPGRRLVVLDARAHELEAAPAYAPPVAIAPESLAYTMYTSGSTGAPKGVLIEHRAVCAFVRGAQELYALTADDRFAHVASPAFDVTTFDFFGSLLTGARLSIAGNETRRSVDRLGRFLREQRTTVYMGTPGLLELIDSSDFPDLRLLAVGGEPFSGEFATRWARGRCLLNSYGPTETTVAVVAKRCEGEWDTSPPIGRPMPNHRAYVLDERLEPLPSNVTGELYVGGPGVARGYMNRPGLTGASFVPDPFAPRPGGRLYRTGDLVRWLPSGELVFLGRTDRQVKISGVRIELGEIETAVRRHPDVQHAVVLTEETADGPARLVAYVVARGRVPSVTSLRASVASWLPPNMIPSEFVPVDAIPLTTAGKVDEATLREERRQHALDVARDVVAPRTETERRVAEEILVPVLGLDAVGVDDNIFELGANSLQVLNVLARVRSTFGVEIRVAQFFQVPTLAGIAAVVDAETTDDHERPDREFLLEAIAKVEHAVERPDRGGPDPLRLAWTASLLELLPERDAEILELAIGKGAGSRALAERHRVTRGELPFARFAAASFDAVVVPEWLVHLPEGEQRAWLERLGAWLRPGGLILAALGEAGDGLRLLEDAGLSAVRHEVVEEQNGPRRARRLWVLAAKPEC